MPARPARKLTIKDTTQKFGDVPFSEPILTYEAFEAQIEELTALVNTLSGEVMGLSGELYATTLDASGDIWNLSAAIAELQPVATELEVEASNKK